MDRNISTEICWIWDPFSHTPSAGITDVCALQFTDQEKWLLDSSSGLPKKAFKMLSTCPSGPTRKPFLYYCIKSQRLTSFTRRSLHPRRARESWSTPRPWFSSGSSTARGPWRPWWARLASTWVVIVWNLIQHLTESAHLAYKEKDLLERNPGREGHLGDLFALST